MTLTTRELFQSPLVECAESRCRAPRSGWSGERSDPGVSLILTRTGVYARRARGRTTIADAGAALLYHGGEPYRISHPLSRARGDSNTILRFGEALRDELFCPLDRDKTAARLAPGAQLAHFAALARWRDPDARDELAGEEGALALLDAVRRDFGLTGTEAPSRPGRRAVERVQARLAAAPELSVGLAELAADAAVSPSRLCRLFRRETGMTLRGYRLRLRLAAALERLSGGEGDLAQLALDLGFSHHSHLTAAFRHYFGAPPAAVRERLRGAGGRRGGTFLTAAATTLPYTRR